MCKKKQFKYCPSEIDECMKRLINELKHILNENYTIVACCCGHKKYHMTIIMHWLKHPNFYRDLVSGQMIPRKRNFYKKDKQGYYFIPEVEEYWRNE